MNVNILLRTILLCILIPLSLAEASDNGDILKIRWSNLLPDLPAQDDPLSSFTEVERGRIEWIMYIRSKFTPEDKEIFNEMNKAFPQLKKKGLDIEKILAYRQFKNFSVNKMLDGKQIKLAGYLLPLEVLGNVATEFLLVPYVGACIHTPPPPPNQIIHAVSNTSTPYVIDRLYKPVSVTGKIETKSSSQELFLVDGSDYIDIGYSMSVNKIEEYKPRN